MKLMVVQGSNNLMAVACNGRSRHSEWAESRLVKADSWKMEGSIMSLGEDVLEDMRQVQHL